MHWLNRLEIRAQDGQDMAICANCGSEAAPHLCSRCQRARYCSRPCQMAHWKRHKRVCAHTDPSSEATAEDSIDACPECAEVWKECKCAESPSCWVCLESSGKLLRGCACRGTAGYLHTACLVEANRHRKTAHDECPTCQTRFVGALSMGAAEARVRDARESTVAATLTMPQPLSLRELVPSRASTVKRCSTITSA